MSRTSPIGADPCCQMEWREAGRALGVRVGHVVLGFQLTLGVRCDGLVHISELAPRRVGKVTDVINEGDEVWVKVLSFDDRGKVRLSMKQVDQATGQEAAPEAKAEATP